MLRLARIRPLHAIIWLVSVLYFVLMARLISGSYVDSYPFLSSAGFDHILEGFALFLRLSGGTVASLPVLHPPVFVLITALDAALRANGYLVLLSIACGIYAMHVGMMRIADRLHVSPGVTAALIVASLFMPLAYFRLFILPDPITIAFMIFSLYGLFRHEESGTPRRWLVVAAACAALAGLTQTYGLIPFLVAAGVWGLSALFGARRMRWDLAVAAVAAVAVVVALQVIWTLLIPHDGRPAEFGLLALSSSMFRYYAHLWTFTDLALAPFFVLTLRWVGMRPLFGSTYALALWLTVIVFALLTLFYQAPVARPTYVYQQIVFLALMVLAAPEVGPDAHLEGDRWLDRLAQFTAVLVIAQSLVVVPDASLPRLSILRFSPWETWLGQAVTAQPQDRFFLGEYCPSRDWVCAEALIPDGPDAHLIRVQSEYRRYQRQAAERGHFGAGVALSRPAPLSPPPRPQGELPTRLQGELPTRLRTLAAPTGYIESLGQTGANLAVSGWAADAAEKKPVVRVHVYIQGKAVASGAPLWPRPDVSAALNLPGTLKTGFHIVLPATAAPATPQSMRLFAEYADGTFGELTSNLH